MLILTAHNLAHDLASIPTTALNFCIFDPAEGDYFFPPLVFFTAIEADCLIVQVDRHRIAIPDHWSITAGDRDTGELIVVPVAALSQRPYDVLTLNPLSSFVPSFCPARVVGTTRREIAFPKTMLHQLTTAPLYPGEAPLCIFIGSGNKLPDTLHLTDMFA